MFWFHYSKNLQSWCLDPNQNQNLTAFFWLLLVLGSLLQSQLNKKKYFFIPTVLSFGMTLEGTLKNGGDIFISLKILLCSTETNSTSYGSPITHLFGARWTRACNHYGRQCPLPVKSSTNRREIKLSLSLPNRVKV